MPNYNERLKEEWRRWEYLEERDAARERAKEEFEKDRRDEDNQIMHDRIRDSNNYNNFNRNYNRDKDF